ncbi:hypothetical protein KVP09_06470 [Alcaligenaceae bacterium CGII-47]|nr:hypothetical protein [Alcaligenaceae bacterium CGII-47]
MGHPAFFESSPKISLYDPLAELLGAADDGVFHYDYTDVVKLAGHSCPTVAGAYLMTIKALRVLYPDSLPERGNILVEFGDSASAGVTGVIANVVSLLTGATGDTGFHGLAGDYNRRDLMFFNADVAGEIAFTRRDTGACVAVSYSAREVPPAPMTMPLLQKILAGEATSEQRASFLEAWQDRVRRILESIDLPGLITVNVVRAGSTA